MKAVVFDMDGILFDTERVCLECWEKVAREHNIDNMGEVATRCIGLNNTDTRALMLDYYGADFDYDGFCKKTSLAFWDEIEAKGLPIMKGVMELLAFLQENGYIIGLASSSKHESVMNHCRRAGIDGYFSAVITGDMVEHSKPLPDIYLKACAALGVEPGEAYAIEDSYNGIRSAHAAGMKPIMVPDMIPPTEEMERLSLWICKDLTEVQKRLQDSRI